MMKVDLPRPDVTVGNNPEGGIDVVVSRDGKARSYKSEPNVQSTTDAVKQVVEKIINDPYTAEWIPRK